MEVTQIVKDGDGFDSKDDHEFMHSVRQYYAYRSMKQQFQVILVTWECYKNRSSILTLNDFRVFLHIIFRFILDNTFSSLVHET